MKASLRTSNAQVLQAHMESVRAIANIVRIAALRQAVTLLRVRAAAIRAAQMEDGRWEPTSRS